MTGRWWAVLVGLITVGMTASPWAPTNFGNLRSTSSGGPTSIRAGLPAGFQAQSLVRVGDTRSVLLTGTVPCKNSVCAVLLRGSPGESDIVHYWRRLRPPPVPTTQGAHSLNVGTLAFANRLDGYDIVGLSTGAGRALLYATIDGGNSWHRADLTSGTVLALAASPSRFYAVTARCLDNNCHDYRLAYSAPGAARWSTTPIPGTALLEGSPIGLAAQGTEVLLNFDPPVEGGQPHLLISSHAGGPFKLHLVRQLASVGACNLSPQAGGAVWASCPTGMSVSYLHSPSADGPYVGVWDYAGTGGGGMVAVTGDIAYRYTGIPTNKLRGDILQRSTNGGRTFDNVGPWPFARNAGVTPQFVFLDAQIGFGLGLAPTKARSSEVVETTDGALHWTKVLP